MSDPLPRLRMDLDLMPSPIEDRPGFLMRDPRGYSDATLIVPPFLAQFLPFFDGSHTELDLREMLVRATGDITAGQAVTHLRETLSTAGFLHDEEYERMKLACHQAFAEADVRPPAHAGSAYPEQEGELRETIGGYLDGEAHGADPGSLIAIAAPHVSPFGGSQSYRAAYRALAAEHADRIFVILGTSHYGAPARFGLTRKPFVTPYGDAPTERRLVDELAGAAPAAVELEDYHHAVEHSIEFQVVFLQHLYGPGVRILPVLCGSFYESIAKGGLPEDDEEVRRFFEALGDMAAREGKRLAFVLGIDMAHMGRRYGDSFAASASAGEMVGIEERDRARIQRVEAGDAIGFWELVRDGNDDDLKWCGSSPVYTFLKAVPQARGELLRYEQWNIDRESVVSFAGMVFRG